MSKDKTTETPATEELIAQTKKQIITNHVKVASLVGVAALVVGVVIGRFTQIDTEDPTE